MVQGETYAIQILSMLSVSLAYFKPVFQGAQMEAHIAGQPFQVVLHAFVSQGLIQTLRPHIVQGQAEELRPLAGTLDGLAYALVHQEGIGGVNKLKARGAPGAFPYQCRGRRISPAHIKNIRIKMEKGYIFGDFFSLFFVIWI